MLAVPPWPEVVLPPVTLVVVLVAFAVVGVPVVGVALVGVAVVGEPVGVGGGTNGSQDVPLAVLAALASAAAVTAERATPEAAVARTVPAISVTVAGRACAKRIPILLPRSAALNTANRPRLGLLPDDSGGFPGEGRETGPPDSGVSGSARPDRYST